MTNEEYAIVRDIARLETAEFLIRECETFNGYPLAGETKTRLQQLKASVTIKNLRSDAGKSRKPAQESLPGVTE